MNKLGREWLLHVMLVPGIVLVFCFSYIPIFGNVIAFKDFTPFLGFKGSPWVGFENYVYVFGLPDTLHVIWNTVYIAFMKIVFGISIPLALALLMNEVPVRLVNNSVQTIIYLPHFMSWIILGGIFIDLLSLRGIVNSLLGMFHIHRVLFLENAAWFPYVLVATDVWKELGFNTLIFLAALTAIDLSLYEAAVMDGAGRFRQALSVTLPGLAPTIILLTALSLGHILNAGFEQVLTLYSPAVYSTGDIVDTFVYRLGLIQAQFGPATAVGLFKSVASFLLVSLSYWVARRFANYRIF